MNYKKNRFYLCKLKKQKTFCNSPKYVSKKRTIPTDDAEERLIGCYLRAKNDQSETPRISILLRHRC